MPLGDNAPRPVAVSATRDHELDFVVRTQVIDVLPPVLFDFSGAGTFHVEDDFRALVDGSDVDRPGGLDQHFEAVVAEPADEIERLLLRERLAAGDLDQLRSIALHARDDVVERHPLAAGERVLRVAPAAAEVAAGEADEDTRPAGVRRLALDRVEDFSDSHTPLDL